MADEIPNWLGQEKERMSNPNKDQCPYCKSLNLYLLPDYSGKCNDCGRSFSDIRLKPKISSSGKIIQEVKITPGESQPGWIKDNYTPRYRQEKTIWYRIWITLSYIGLIIEIIAAPIYIILIAHFSPTLAIIGIIGIFISLLYTYSFIRIIQDLYE